jgi:integrase
MECRHITADLIEDIPLAKGKPVVIADDQIKGYRLKVNKRRKLLHFQGEYRGPGGKRNTIYLALPLHDADRARKLAFAESMHLERLRKGTVQFSTMVPPLLHAWAGDVVPRPGAQSMPRSITADLSYRAHVKRDCSARTMEFYESVVERHLLRFHGTLLCNIQRTDVIAEHARITREAGPYAANSMLRLGSAIYNHVANVLDVELPAKNPFRRKGISNVEEARQSGMSEAELGPWFETVAKLDNTIMRELYFIALMTGLRRGDLLTARHADVLTDRIKLPMPKSQKPSVIPLTLVVSRALDRIKRASAGIPAKSAPWIFASKESKSGHITEPRITGLPSLHACRHTYRAACAGAGIAEVHSKLLMLHSLGGVHDSYITTVALFTQLATAAEQVATYIARHLPADAEERLEKLAGF